MAQLHPKHDISYAPPRGNVLLLSCMDLRLLDEIVAFMNHDNLANRYDHVVFAGAALGALGAPGAKDEHGKPIDVSYWRRVFFDHLRRAIELHDVKDVYILEHRNCGAYYKVFHVCEDFGNSEAERAAEAECHGNYATLLEGEITAWASQEGVALRTHKFLMGLRGEVSVLSAPPKVASRKSQSRSGGGRGPGR